MPEGKAGDPPITASFRNRVDTPSSPSSPSSCGSSFIRVFVLSGLLDATTELVEAVKVAQSNSEKFVHELFHVAVMPEVDEASFTRSLPLVEWISYGFFTAVINIAASVNMEHGSGDHSQLLVRGIAHLIGLEGLTQLVSKKSNGHKCALE